MILPAAWSAALASAAVLALFLGRLGLKARLFGDALALGATLGATIALVLAPFDLRTNPFHFAPATLAFLFAGVPEEAIKLLGAAALLRGHFRARSPRDVMLASGGLALGFATLENLFYLANAGAAWAPLAAERALTAGPFHVLLGLAGGFAAARAPASLKGAAFVVAAGAGLAAIHGLYDFAVLAAPAPPEALARLGLDPDLALRGLMVAAEAAAALAAAGALRALPGEPRRGLLQGRAVGWAMAVALAGGALVAVLIGLAAINVLDSFETLGIVLIFATLPFSVGMMSAPTARPFSRRVRRTLAGLGLAGLALGSLAGWAFGPANWRRLDETRQEARGARLAANRDFAGAEEALGRAITDAPGRAEPLAARASVRAASRRFDAARDDLDAALRLAPGSAPLHGQRADVERQANALGPALIDLDAAVRLAPGQVNWLALRAQARLETGDTKGALDDLTQARSLAPADPLVRDVSAAWEMDAGDFDAALRDLNARLHDDPGDADALFRRGRAWFYKDEFARAEADFEQAEAGAQELYPALWRALAQARRRIDAGPDLRARLARKPEGWPAPVARMLLGEIDPAAARAQAGDDGERCEADFYFAASRLALDSPLMSAERLRAALGECPASFIEYEGAKAELRRLGF